MNNDVNYETAWKFLKNIIAQYKKSQTYVMKSSSDVSEFDQAKGMEYMAGLILEDMECMEEGIADAMRGEKADE